MKQKGFAIIEIFLAMTLLTFIACSMPQYFVWVTTKTRDNYFHSVRALANFSKCQHHLASQHQEVASNKNHLLTIIWPDDKLLAMT